MLPCREQAPITFSPASYGLATSAHAVAFKLARFLVQQGLLRYLTFYGQSQGRIKLQTPDVTALFEKKAMALWSCQVKVRFLELRPDKAIIIGEFLFQTVGECKLFHVQSNEKLVLLFYCLFTFHLRLLKIINAFTYIFERIGIN